MKKLFNNFWASFFSVPSITPPKYLLSLTNKRAYDSGLNFYSAFSLKSKLKKQFLGKGYVLFNVFKKLGVLNSPEDENLNPLKGFLETEIGSGNEVNIYVPSYNKAVIQVVDTSGKCEKIIKVAFNANGKRALEAEANNLKTLAQVYFQYFEVPKVINKGVRRGIFFVENTSPKYYRPLDRHEFSERIIKILSELFSVNVSSYRKISESFLFHNLKEKTELIKNEELKELFYKTLNLYTDILPEIEIPFGIVHYDFKPWNMLINQETNRIVLVDWELMREKGLPLWDAYSYILFTYFTLHYDASPAQALKFFVLHGDFLNAYVKEVKIEKNLINTMLPLYLLDLASNNSLWERWDKSEDRPSRILKSIKNLLVYLLEKQYYKNYG